MKRLVIGCWLLVVGLLINGCATTITVVKGGGPDPAGEAYNKVLLVNPTPFYVVPAIGIKNLILEPGSELITKKTRPLGWLSPAFGNFSFWAYAYRKYDPRTGKPDEFVGQQQFGVYLNGRLRMYNGRVYGGIVIMDYFPVSSFGHPDRWQGRIGGIVPWRAEFRHY